MSGDGELDTSRIHTVGHEQGAPELRRIIEKYLTEVAAPGREDERQKGRQKGKNPS